MVNHAAAATAVVLDEKDENTENNVDEKILMRDYAYDLRAESIAKYPAEPRGSSRLLRVDARGEVAHFRCFSESFPSLAKGAHVVFNESRVVHARVEVVPASSSSSGSVAPLELMILDLGDDGVRRRFVGRRLTVMLRREGVRRGEMFVAANHPDVEFAVTDVVGPWIEDAKSDGNGTECVVECARAPQHDDDHDHDDDDDATLAETLAVVGSVPIPPYLDRDAEPVDERAYNNVYATKDDDDDDDDAGLVDGRRSVAAPTAGLHFTDDLLAELGPENASFLSLHVGAGTFRPVAAEDARDHSMHGETFSVRVKELRRVARSLETRQRLVVVGTTSCRTLESLYWCGVKILEETRSDDDRGDDDQSSLTLGQHEWTRLAKHADKHDAATALRAVVRNRADNELVEGRTSLMIVPGTYDFKVVTELVTNFHAPDSTLMLLVSAFLGSGDKVRSVYHQAQDLGYRFLSYGDVCFFSKPEKHAQ